MAYVSQELKARLAPQMKAICKKFGIHRSSIAVHNHSTLVLNIASGSIDFFESFNRIGAQSPRHPNNPYIPRVDYIQINPHWYFEHCDGKALEFLTEIMAVMNDGNHDHSDIMTDYFDVGWYKEVNIGKWDKPYILNKD